MLIDSSKYHSGALKFRLDETSILYHRQPASLFFIKFDLIDGKPFAQISCEVTQDLLQDYSVVKEGLINKIVTEKENQ